MKRDVTNKQLYEALDGPIRDYLQIGPQALERLLPRFRAALALVDLTKEVEDRKVKVIFKTAFALAVAAASGGEIDEDEEEEKESGSDSVS